MTPESPGASDTDGDAALAALRTLIGGTARRAVRLPLLTGSMAPALLPGDTLLVRTASGKNVHTGDIAVFLKDGKVTAHRIVFAFRLGPWAFLLEMGDANRLAAQLRPAAVLGVVEAVERGGSLIPFARGTGAPEAGRAARRQARGLFWRYFTGALPAELMKRAAGR